MFHSFSKGLQGLLAGDTVRNVVSSRQGKIESHAVLGTGIEIPFRSIVSSTVLSNRLISIPRISPM